NLGAAAASRGAKAAARMSAQDRNAIGERDRIQLRNIVSQPLQEWNPGPSRARRSREKVYRQCDPRRGGPRSTGERLDAAQGLVCFGSSRGRARGRPCGDAIGRRGGAGERRDSRTRTSQAPRGAARARLRLSARLSAARADSVGGYGRGLAPRSGLLVRLSALLPQPVEWRRGRPPPGADAPPPFFGIPPAAGRTARRKPW